MNIESIKEKVRLVKLSHEGKSILEIFRDLNFIIGYIPDNCLCEEKPKGCNIKSDYLVGLTDEKTYDTYDLRKKNEDDILMALKDLESRLKNSDTITFCGQPASDEAIDGILHSIKAGISLAISDIKRK